MTSPESPAGARRRVRLALREARLARHYTQGDVAEAMEWSASKVIRIENGEVTVSPNDLRPLLAHLGIADKATVDKLIQDARASRRRASWWDEPELREHMTPASRQLIQFELETVTIRNFTNVFFPGPLQTPAYAEAMLRAYGSELTDDEIAVRLRARMRRRTDFLGRRDFPKTFLLLDEAILRRRIGGPVTSSEQLLDLLRMSRQKPISIRVLPFTIDNPPVIGPFDILDLSGGGNSVIYRESINQDEIVEEPRNVARHREMFDRYWDLALSEPQSAQLIEQSAKELAGSRSDPPPDPPGAADDRPPPAARPAKRARPPRPSR